MKHRMLFISITLFALAAAASAQTSAAAPMPHLEKRGAPPTWKPMAGRMRP
jgi:hypothetical protein